MPPLQLFLELIYVPFYIIRNRYLLSPPDQFDGFWGAVSNTQAAANAGVYIHLGYIFKLQRFDRAYIDA